MSILMSMTAAIKIAHDKNLSFTTPDPMPSTIAIDIVKAEGKVKEYVSKSRESQQESILCGKAYCLATQRMPRTQNAEYYFGLYESSTLKVHVSDRLQKRGISETDIDKAHEFLKTEFGEFCIHLSQRVRFTLESQMEFVNSLNRSDLEDLQKGIPTTRSIDLRRVQGRHNGTVEDDFCKAKCNEVRAILNSLYSMNKDQPIRQYSHTTIGPGCYSSMPETAAKIIQKTGQTVHLWGFFNIEIDRPIEGEKASINMRNSLTNLIKKRHELCKPTLDMPSVTLEDAAALNEWIRPMIGGTHGGKSGLLEKTIYSEKRVRGEPPREVSLAKLSLEKAADFQFKDIVFFALLPVLKSIEQEFESLSPKSPPQIKGKPPEKASALNSTN